MTDDVVFRRVEWEKQGNDYDAVPANLSSLIPLAEILGPDGHMNVEFVFNRIPQDERESWQRTLTEHREALAAWVDEVCEAGPPYPECHVRFSGLRMYADFLAGTV